MSDDDSRAPAPPPPARGLSRLLAQAFASLVFAPLAFAGLALWLGLPDQPGVGWGLIVSGALVALLSSWFAGFLGETWIEDLVKTAMVAALLYFVRDHPLPASIVAGLFAGFLASTLAKLVRVEMPARQVLAERAAQLKQVEQDRLERRLHKARARAERMAPQETGRGDAEATADDDRTER